MTQSQENVVSPTSPFLFTNVSRFFFYPLSYPLFCSMTCFLPASMRNASYAAYSQFPPLPSSSLWVPCCSSCIVRLQVVWEQDLSRHMLVGETPWLTWLLRGRDGQKERWGPTQYKNASPEFFFSQYITFILNSIRDIRSFVGLTLWWGHKKGNREVASSYHYEVNISWI